MTRILASGEVSRAVECKPSLSTKVAKGAEKRRIKKKVGQL
jgi:hypothetical protein